MPKPISSDVKYLCSCEEPADVLFRPHESVRPPMGIPPMYAACFSHTDRAFMYLATYKVLRIDVVTPDA